MAGLNRCQNPLYLRFAELTEQFVKELVHVYVPKHCKSGLGATHVLCCLADLLVWKDNGNDVSLPLQSSIFGSQVDSYCPPAYLSGHPVVFHGPITHGCTCGGFEVSVDLRVPGCRHGEQARGVRMQGREGDMPGVIMLQDARDHSWQARECAHWYVPRPPSTLSLVENCENVTVHVEHVAVAVDVINSRNIEVLVQAIQLGGGATTSATSTQATLPGVNINQSHGVLLVLGEKTASELQVNAIVSTRIHVQVGSV